MTDQPKRPSRAELVRQGFERDRAAHPDRFIDPASPTLFAENVAAMLGCHLDTVRRIPRDQLPATRVGNRVVYLQDDVTRYVRNRREHGKSVQPVAPLPPMGAAPSTFDPVANARRLTKGEKR